MYIEYRDHSSITGKEFEVTESIEEFIYKRILHEDSYNMGYRLIRLEHQPKVVCDALGRLVNRLLEKNVLNLEDLHWIAGTQWDSIKDDARLKADD